jgi:hypothetical protein
MVGVIRVSLHGFLLRLLYGPVVVGQVTKMTLLLHQLEVIH